MRNSNQKAKKIQYRSKFEQRLADRLLKLGFKYEPYTLNYSIPTTEHTYRPDFVRGKLIYELKGRFTVQDRKKMKLLVEQHPEYDFVMVFQNPNIKINKGSKTTYADWCNKNHINWMSYKELFNND